MEFKNIKYTVLSLMAIVALASCSNDDDNTPVTEIATCDDGIMNGDETGVDCGGTCTACDDAMEPDFTGTYAQVDFMGRPGINTVLSADDATKDLHNMSIPSEMGATFQASFQATLEVYYGVYGAEYENNILGLDAPTLTGYLAADVLEVAPNLTTAYFIPGEDVDMDGNVLNDPAVIALTGRTPQDDVIDVSLILLFGGEDGNRFSGQDTDNDGMADLPRLTSDGVGLTADIGTTFPYLGAPE